MLLHNINNSSFHPVTYWIKWGGNSSTTGPPKKTLNEHVWNSWGSSGKITKVAIESSGGHKMQRHSKICRQISIQVSEVIHLPAYLSPGSVPPLPTCPPRCYPPCQSADDENCTEVLKGMIFKVRFFSCSAAGS